jgi:hypothetical protein
MSANENGVGLSVNESLKDRRPSQVMNQSQLGQRGSLANIAIPNETGTGAVEVPATRSSISDASPYMHNLSINGPKERRGSRNSFGAQLPIPRSKRQSRLSSVAYASGQAQRPGMPSIQPTREILAGQVQDQSAEKVKAAKNMGFVFDIDGVLVHGATSSPASSASPWTGSSSSSPTLP